MPNDKPPAALRARAVLPGDRLAIDRSRYARVQSLSSFAFALGHGFAVAFRYGVVVLIGLTEEPAPDGILRLREIDLPRALVIANVLAKSVALARYEREIALVLDTIEPAAATCPRAAASRARENRYCG